MFTQYNPNTVYYDSEMGQYYTASSPVSAGMDTSNSLYQLMNSVTPLRNYIGGSLGGVNEKSMVSDLIANRQPYQYNVPSLASMFPSLQGQMQGQPQGQMPMQGGGAGAGRFMGGLLGSMPTPVSSTTTQAPSTGGAGRFL